MPVRPSSQVWFCLACDDQPPWKAHELKPCPTCKSTDQVKSATRIPGMENLGES
jgi:Zn finger protein HypA/HybF involved in hydrogenase expression